MTLRIGMLIFLIVTIPAVAIMMAKMSVRRFLYILLLGALGFLGVVALIFLSYKIGSII